jgi:hypothetical protein
MTPIDRALLREMDADRQVTAHGDFHSSDAFEQILRAGRLAKLS